MKSTPCAGLCALLLSGASAIAGYAQAGGSLPDLIASAVADPARPLKDRDRDGARKPVESLQFSGVKPGDVVADFNAGAGYFTRLFADVVGSRGHVYAIEPAEIQKYIAKATGELQTYAANHPNVTETLHRIEPTTVRREVEGAAFRFEGESSILANPADPLTIEVFDKSVQGHTDQFLLKFRKPG